MPVPQPQTPATGAWYLLFEQLYVLLVLRRASAA
jgi:hypothetical protein